MAVKVFGDASGGRVRRDLSPSLKDPDPQQLVMAWDSEARAKESARSRKSAKPAVGAHPGKAGEAKKKAATSKAGKASPAPKATPAKKAAGAEPGRTARGSQKSGTIPLNLEAPATRNPPGTKASSSKGAGAREGSPHPSPLPPLGGEGRDGAPHKSTLRLEGREGREGSPHLKPLPRKGGEGRKVAPPVAVPLDDVVAGSAPEPAPAAASAAGEASIPSATPGGNGHGSGSGATAVEAGEYTGDQIQILEGVQHMRQRPGMYIGSTSTSGLLHLVYEAIDNVVDEFNAGHGSRMWIAIDRDGRVTVRDEARGIPIDPKEWGGAVLPTATWIFIKPFSGGKFEPGVYKQAGGLHGVGLTVINALSAELDVQIWRDGQHFRQQFRQGEAQGYRIQPCDPSLHGTQLSWLPDPAIFDEDATYDVEALLSRLEATACLNRGLRIELTYWDEENKKSVRRVLHSENGLADYVRTLAAASAPPLFRQPISIVKTKDDVFVEVVLQPDKGYKTQMFSFANGVRTPDGGTHEIGFRAALTKLVNDYALKWNLIKDRAKEALKPDVIQQGLSVVISVKLADPQFQGQTKNRLNNAPVDGIVRSVVSEGLTEWFETNQSHGKEWLKKIHLAQKARNEAQLAEELARTGQKRGSELVDVSLSKKFAACNGNDPERNELFLVEGESAGGSAKQARRSEFQAILALKGKPLNVANASLQRILDNEEIRTIISVIGTGTRHLFDIEKLRFHKIIILSDADVDGSHIVCLLLTLFHQEMPGLIEAGHVYLGCPPLYSVKYKGKTVWLTDDEARRQFLRQHPDAGSLEFKRYKGLGEMNASELRETTMDPAKRVLRRVTLEDSVLASKLVNDLMARENAEARRALLSKQAKHLAAAGNLDV